MPTIRQMQTGLYEDVRGTIIGDVTFPYEFWTTREEFGQTKIDKGFFQNDEEAIEWFRITYPEWFQKGVEMRCFDGR